MSQSTKYSSTDEGSSIVCCTRGTCPIFSHLIQNRVWHHWMTVKNPDSFPSIFSDLGIRRLLPGVFTTMGWISRFSVNCQLVLSCMFLKLLTVWYHSTNIDYLPVALPIHGRDCQVIHWWQLTANVWPLPNPLKSSWILCIYVSWDLHFNAENLSEQCCGLLVVTL